MISLCMITKNEGHCLGSAIESAKPFVDKIIIIDDHSTDNTLDIARSFNTEITQLDVRIKDVGFSYIANALIQRAQDWCLILDADELLTDGHLITNLIQSGHTAFAFPRRKWENYQNRKREELEAYPDWQIRLIKNIPGNVFKGDMHIRFQGKQRYAWRGPHIEHLQNELRTSSKIQDRLELYPLLANKQHVQIVGGDIV